MTAGGGRGPLLAALALALVSCARPGPQGVPAAAEPLYLVGEPYSLRGVWHYPREDYALAETGLAGVAADAMAGRRTSNGEVYDPAALTAAHRTVQLPAILRVTNLENGRSLLVRVNDRGPADPGRVVELSRRATELLGVSPQRPAQVRAEVEGRLSRALAASLGRAPGEEPAQSVAAAPGGVVQRESLAPIPGTQQAARIREARGPLVAVSADFGDLAPPPARLPELVAQGDTAPGRLWVQAGTFSGADAARRQATRLPGAQAEPFGPGRRPEWRVRLGPFADVSVADGALDRVLRAGVSEARIVVD